MANETHWIRFRYGAEIGFGTLTPSGIFVHSGEMFGVARPTGSVLPVEDVEVLAPRGTDQDHCTLEQLLRASRQAELTKADGAALSPQSSDQRHRIRRRYQSSRLL